MSVAGNGTTALRQTGNSSENAGSNNYYCIKIPLASDLVFPSLYSIICVHETHCFIFSLLKCLQQRINYNHLSLKLRSRNSERHPHLRCINEVHIQFELI